MYRGSPRGFFDTGVGLTGVLPKNRSLWNVKQQFQNMSEYLRWMFVHGPSVPFLDLEISCHNVRWKFERKLSFEPYEKPQNRHLYTSPKTNAPQQQTYKFGWIPAGENVRLLRKSSDKQSFTVAMENLRKNLSNAGY